MNSSVCVILNPAAGRGKGRRNAPAVRAAFAVAGLGAYRETKAPGDEAILVREALDQGFTTIVAAGGDGTWSNVGRAILREGAAGSTTLALIAAGTGNDLAKSIGAPASDYAETARLVVEGRTKQVDAGKVDGDYFLNSVGFGFDASVLATIGNFSRLRGSAVYGVAALRQLFTYRGIKVRSTGVVLPERSLMIIVANGGYLGGAFHITPGASVSDGMLDTLAVADMPAVRRLSLFAAAVRGNHTGRPGVSTARYSTLSLSFESPPLCQRDGELDQLAGTTVTLSCEPGALRVTA